MRCYLAVHLTPSSLQENSTQSYLHGSSPRSCCCCRFRSARVASTASDGARRLTSGARASSDSPASPTPSSSTTTPVRAPREVPQPRHPTTLPSAPLTDRSVGERRGRPAGVPEDADRHGTEPVVCRHAHARHEKFLCALVALLLEVEIGDGSNSIFSLSLRVIFLSPSVYVPFKLFPLVQLSLLFFFVPHEVFHLLLFFTPCFVLVVVVVVVSVFFTCLLVCWRVRCTRVSRGPWSDRPDVERPGPPKGPVFPHHADLSSIPTATRNEAGRPPLR